MQGHCVSKTIHLGDQGSQKIRTGRHRLGTSRHPTAETLVKILFGSKNSQMLEKLRERKALVKIPLYEPLCPLHGPKKLVNGRNFWQIGKLLSLRRLTYFTSILNIFCTLPPRRRRRRECNTFNVSLDYFFLILSKQIYCADGMFRTSIIYIFCKAHSLYVANLIYTFMNIDIETSSVYAHLLYMIKNGGNT